MMKKIVLCLLVILNLEARTLNEIRSSCLRSKKNWEDAISGEVGMAESALRFPLPFTSKTTLCNDFYKKFQNFYFVQILENISQLLELHEKRQNESLSEYELRDLDNMLNVTSNRLNSHNHLEYTLLIPSVRPVPRLEVLLNCVNKADNREYDHGSPRAIKLRGMFELAEIFGHAHVGNPMPDKDRYRISIEEAKNRARDVLETNIAYLRSQNANPIEEFAYAAKIGIKDIGGQDVKSTLYVLQGGELTPSPKCPSCGGNQ